MDSEQNDATDSNVAENTNDARSNDENDAASVEDGIGDDADEYDVVASSGDGAAGNDDGGMAMVEKEEEEEEEDAAIFNLENDAEAKDVDIIEDLDDSSIPDEKLNTNNPSDDGGGPVVECDGKKRSIVDDDDPEKTDEYGPLPSFPLKRSRTAYFIFADEKRRGVTQEHQGEGVAAIGKAIGLLWSALDPAEKEVYVTRAVKEKEMYNRDVQRLKDAGRWPDSSPDADAGGGEDGLIFPIGRIRKICKLDPDVKGISKESALLITKATELFCDKLGNECVVMAQMQNRRKLECKDVVEVCSSKESFMFLRSDMIDLRRAQQAETNQKGIDSGKERAVKAGEASLPRNNLDTYFGKIPH